MKISNLDKDEIALWSIVVFVVAFLVVLIYFAIDHERNYECIRGHYETRSRYDVTLKMIVFEDVYICDEELPQRTYDSLVKIGQTP